MDSRALFPALALATLLPGAPDAHPHVFIDAGFELVFDPDGQLEAVRIEWAYDEFYSLMLIEENGLDADADGVPDAAALAAFAGRDVAWEEGFPGDFTLERDGAAVALLGPVEHSARYEAGRYVTTHLRPLAHPFDPAGEAVAARVYDPTYFVAYDLPEPPGIAGRQGCRLDRDAADRAAAEAEYGERLSAIDAGEDPFEEIELPDIGILFADRFVLTCAAAS
ncbi:DUF1007 family protein [Roseivivax sp. CAU 1761]